MAQRNVELATSRQTSVGEWKTNAKQKYSIVITVEKLLC